MEKCSHFSMTFLLILHAANAATEMKRQRNRGAQLIAADCDFACGECRDRDEAPAESRCAAHCGRLRFCMRRMPRPRWSASGIEVRSSLRPIETLHAASAATEMERQRASRNSCICPAMIFISLCLASIVAQAMCGVMKSLSLSFTFNSGRPLP